MATLRIGENTFPINDIHAVRTHERNLVETEVSVDEIVERANGSGDISLLVSHQRGGLRQEIVLRLDPTLITEIQKGATGHFDPQGVSNPAIRTTARLRIAPETN